MVGPSPLRARPCAPSPRCSSRSWPCSSRCCRSPLPPVPRPRRSTRPPSTHRQQAQHQTQPQAASPSTGRSSSTRRSSTRSRSQEAQGAAEAAGPAAAQLRGAGHQLLQLPEPEQGRAAGDPQPGAEDDQQHLGRSARPASARRCPSNGTIRIATWSFDDWDVAHALVAAQKRGVSVQIVAAKTRNATHPAWRWLRKQLGPKLYRPGYPLSRDTVSFARRVPRGLPWPGRHRRTRSTSCSRTSAPRTSRRSPSRRR